MHWKMDLLTDPYAAALKLKLFKTAEYQALCCAKIEGDFMPDCYSYSVYYSCSGNSICFNKTLCKPMEVCFTKHICNSTHCTVAGIF